MNLHLILIPFCVSCLIGYLLLDILTPAERRVSPVIHLFLSPGLGLALSALIIFFSLVVLNRLHWIAVFSLHIIILTHLLIIKLIAFWGKNKWPIKIPWQKPPILNIILFILLLLALIPICIHARYYPFGGWDAWQVWNYKAKFILLAEDKWQNVFNPVLWRSSPHYPLLLPLINVWGWALVKKPLELVPMLTSIIYTFTTAGLLFYGLKSLTKKSLSILAPLLLLALPFYETIATSQYSDIVVGYYLLASFYCLTALFSGYDSRYSFWAGLFLGFLSFTKPEGMIAALLIASLTVGLLIHVNRKDQIPWQQSALPTFLLGFGLALIPTILFQIFYSPGNQTFINGFISPEKPVSLERLKFIIAFMYFEFISPKWGWVLLLLTGGALFSLHKSFRREIILIPLFLISYSLILIVYYWTNTYFEITWWLQVTLNRIIVSLLPTFAFGVFYCIAKTQDEVRRS